MDTLPEATIPNLTPRPLVFFVCVIPADDIFTVLLFEVLMVGLTNLLVSRFMVVLTVYASTFTETPEGLLTE